MQCPYCDHPQAYKHDRTSKGNQRFKCPQCGQTFTETLNILYYQRQVTVEEVETILQTHAEGSRLRGVSRVSRRADGTVVSLLRAASEQSQLVHNQSVQSVETASIVADEVWSFVQKNNNAADRKRARREMVGLA
jgi:transposase-like protein